MVSTGAAAPENRRFAADQLDEAHPSPPEAAHLVDRADPFAEEAIDHLRRCLTALGHPWRRARSKLHLRKLWWWHARHDDDPAREGLIVAKAPCGLRRLLESRVTGPDRSTPRREVGSLHAACADDGGRRNFPSVSQSVWQRPVTVELTLLAGQLSTLWAAPEHRPLLMTRSGAFGPSTSTASATSSRSLSRVCRPSCSTPRVGGSCAAWQRGAEANRLWSTSHDGSPTCWFGRRAWANPARPDAALATVADALIDLAVSIQPSLRGSRLVAMVDPSGLLSPPLVGARFEGLDASLAEVETAVARIGSGWPEGSPPWRAIAVHACRWSDRLRPDERAIVWSYLAHSRRGLRPGRDGHLNHLDGLAQTAGAFEAADGELAPSSGEPMADACSVTDQSPSSRRAFIQSSPGSCPKGWLRDIQLRTHRLAEGDESGLLLAVGADCIGAVVVVPAHTA